MPLLALRHRHVLLGGVVTLSLAGCLVSFDDYRLGDPHPNEHAGAGGQTASGGQATGGTSKGGSSGGTSSGGTSSGASGGTHSGGTVTTSGGTGTGGSNVAGMSNAGGAIGGDHMPMIDDFEDGDDAILDLEGRAGIWGAYNDGTGTQQPAEGDQALPETLDPPRDSSMMAFHTTGQYFDDWGAIVRVNINEHTANDAQPYDASAYTGIKLWVRSGDGTTHKAIVGLPSSATDGDCTVCGDYFGNAVQFTDAWKEVTLPFSQMVQQNWGDPQLPEIDPSSLTAFQLSISAGNPFDIWIDDLRFY